MADNTTTERFVADTREYSRPLREAAQDADRFGEHNNAAALAARKMAQAAKEAGERASKGMRDAAEAAKLAEEAQKAAADAAEKLAREEIGADEAAQAQARAQKKVAEAAEAQARALNAVERADIKAAESSLAAGRAADKQAEQYRQVARDAELAAGVQQLAWLKANGTGEQHNNLLNKLRKDYGQLGQDATAGMQELENASAGAAESASVMGPAIAVAIALVPPAATLAAGAITFGLGGALAAVGLKATMGSREAKAALDDLKSHASGVMSEIDKPFEHTWTAMADAAKTALDGVAPDLKAIFADVAPEVSKFAETLGRELPGDLHNLLSAVDRDFGPIADELGATLPDALKKVADGLAQIMDEAAKHPQIVGDLIGGIATLVQAIETMIVWLEKAMEAAEYVKARFDDAAIGVETVGTAMTHMAGPLSLLGGLLKEVGSTAEIFTGTTRSGATDVARYGESIATAAGASAKAAAANKDLAQSTDNATRSLKDLSDALAAYLDPQIAAYEDTTKLKQQVIDLADALKKSKTGLDDNTQSGRAARAAFTDAIKTTEDLGIQTEKATGSQQKAGEAIKAYIAKLWEMAGTSPAARQQVADLATEFGVAIPTQGKKAKGAIDGVHDAMGALKNPPAINLRVNTAQALAAVNSVQQAINNLFGHAAGGLAYRHGGPALGFAGGGATQDHPKGEIHGPGTTTSDSITARVSKGEFIVNAKSYAANAGLVNTINAAKGKVVTSGHEISNPAARNVSGITLPAYSPMGAAHRSYAETLNGGSGGSSRPIVNAPNVYIAGSVWSEQELASVIQRVFLNNGWSLTMPAGR